MILNSKIYDKLKYIALVILPAFSALYFGLGEIWGLPKVTEVIGTIAVLDTVLGGFIRQSNLKYKNSDERFDGSIEVSEEDDRKMFSLNLDSDPEKLDQKNEVVFRVDTPTVETIEFEEDPTPVPPKRAPRKRVSKPLE